MAVFWIEVIDAASKSWNEMERFVMENIGILKVINLKSSSLL
ncbi:MAG TPA: hypothetical protein VG982_00525 [Candidatus Paceibacterota bacterium]|nr:hypothetical protein [Candidatus Paceibacterota bacterium]